MKKRYWLIIMTLLMLPPGALSADSGQITDFTVIDKPNDNGSGVVLIWPRTSRSPQRTYEVFMAELGLKASLHKSLDKLMELGVIDESRRAELANEIDQLEHDGKLFWSQGTWVAAWAPGEVSAMQLSPLKSDLPGSFGFPSDHQERKKSECVCSACSEHALELTKFVRGELVLRTNVIANDKLVQEVRKARVADIEDDAHELSRHQVYLKMVSKPLERGKEYYFRISSSDGEQPVAASDVAAMAASSDWFGWHRTNVLAAMLVLSGLIMASASYAKRHAEKLFIRRIGGLEAVDDALGRAAEMGKPVFFCFGPGDLGSVVNIASINILGKVAERVAEYGTELKVTCMNYMVMQVGQEMVRDAYTRAGRPDAYRDENIYFVSANTFAYSAAVSAQMIREKAGTAFFFGHFGSESLLLSETGAVTKAIQIAGTDSFNQIPFFITTCDYTLIAEEMYAASAYLSREARLVGAVKGQDAVKAVTMTLIILGAALASFNIWSFARWFWPLT